MNVDASAPPEKSSWSKSVLGKILYILKNVTVEPIIFCNFLAFAFFRVAEHAGVYQVICIQNYDHLPNVDCYHLKDRPDIEDKVRDFIYFAKSHILSLLNLFFNPLIWPYFKYTTCSVYNKTNPVICLFDTSRLGTGHPRSLESMTLEPWTLEPRKQDPVHLIPWHYYNTWKIRACSCYREKIFISE